MSASFNCPICNSTQLTPQKRGFSGRKAQLTTVPTSGVAIQPDSYGSSDMDRVCLTCGATWTSAKRVVPENQYLNSIKRFEKREVWRRNFISLYQSGQLDEAAKLLKKEHPRLYENLGLAGAYETIKKKMTSQTNGELIGFLLVAFIIAIMVILVIKSSH